MIRTKKKTRQKWKSVIRTKRKLKKRKTKGIITSQLYVDIIVNTYTQNIFNNCLCTSIKTYEYDVQIIVMFKKEI